MPGMGDLRKFEREQALGGQWDVVKRERLLPGQAQLRAADRAIKGALREGAADVSREELQAGIASGSYAVQEARQLARWLMNRGKERTPYVPAWWSELTSKAPSAADRALADMWRMRQAIEYAPRGSGEMGRAIGDQIRPTPRNPTWEWPATGKAAAGGGARTILRWAPLASAMMQVAELGGSTPQEAMRQQWYDKFKQREGVAGAPAKFNPGPFRPPWK